MLYVGSVEKPDRPALRPDGRRNRNAAVPLTTGWRPNRDGLARARLVGMTDAELVAEIKQFRRHHLKRRTLSPRWDLVWLGWCRGWQVQHGRRPEAKPGSLDADEHDPMTFGDYVKTHGFSEHIERIALTIGHREELAEQAWSKFVYKQLKRPPIVARRWPAVFRAHLQARSRA